MRIAVAGLGFMGSTHLTALRNVEGAELTAVVSEDPDKLSGDLTKVSGNLGRKSERLDFSAVRKYRRLEEALADPMVEAVDLCLPTYLHEAAAIAALEAGKHVLVEKPMALDGAACDRMLAAAARSGKILMCAQVLRFWSDFQPLIETVKNGRLGPVRSALFRRRCAAPQWGKWLQDPEKGGGGVFDLLIHDVDMCVHLFGVPEAVSATGYEDLSEGLDVITAQLHYPGIGSVVVTGGWHHPAAYPFSMEYTVNLDGGTYEFSSMDRPVALYTDGGTRKNVVKPDVDGFQAEIEYFAKCASAGIQPARCDPNESAAAVKLTRLMVEARTRNGEKMPCQI
ncbi:MAG: Gfo/Idh/MocA family oxidoreductase [Bryobacteraceae bacterium]